MLRYSEEFYTQRFTAGTMKDAYMKAVKWYASNILSKSDKMKNVLVEYIKEVETNTVIVKLYASLTDESTRAQHCAICIESHSSIFSHERTNCDWCQIKGYQNRIDRNISIKKQYLSEVLRGN